MEVKPGQVWLARGLWEHEPQSKVRISEVLAASVDVNYDLKSDEPGDYRILPLTCLVERVEE